jgi:hypothetical protein
MGHPDIPFPDDADIRGRRRGRGRLPHTTPTRGERCLDCTYFTPTSDDLGTCSIWKRTVSSMGWCNHFKPRAPIKK